MTIREARAFGELQLRFVSNEESLTDSTVLLCHAANIGRYQLLARQNDHLPDHEYQLFIDLLSRRKKGWPCAYLTGHKEFYSLDFLVDDRVLIPRADTEILVEAVLNTYDHSNIDVHDCCTGSGAIAIALKHHRPKWKVSASDFCFDALDVCRYNSTKILKEEIPVIHSDLLSNVEGPFEVITSNPPYLTEMETLERMELGWKEPSMALASGLDGLSHSRLLIRQASLLLKRNGILFLESAPSLMEELQRIFEKEGFSDITIYRDLASLERVITGKRGF